jgi:hypothetical protein
MVEYTFEIELDAELVEMASAVQLTNDEKTIKDKFREISKYLIWPIESGSGYYWEIRNIRLCTRHKQLTYSAIIYLGCTMRDDRAWQRPEDQPVKRRSEARAPITRYSCAGNIKLFIDITKKRATVNVHHQIQHERPTYRQVIFPIEAKEWIKANIGDEMACRIQRYIGDSVKKDSSIQRYTLRSRFTTGHPLLKKILTL